MAARRAHPACGDDTRPGLRCCAEGAARSAHPTPAELFTPPPPQATLRRPRPPYMVQDMLIISVDKFSFPSGTRPRPAALCAPAFLCCAATY